MEKDHFEQAKLWLEGAAYVSRLPLEDRNKYSVAIAMAIHSVMKANDALTIKFMNKVARRHDETRTLFGELIKQRHVQEKYSDYKNILQDAINDKEKAECQSSVFSKNDFDVFQRKAEKFLSMVEEIV